jgi:hypothetical protein
MRAKKRKTVCVVLYTGLIDAPPEHGMTLFTVASILAAVEIRMAIGALAPHLPEI